MTTRRAFLGALGGGLLATPRVVRAQEGRKVFRIGLLSPFSPADATAWHRAFREGLRDLGWVEGKNISIESRYADGNSDRLSSLVADFLRLKVDVIVTSVTPDTMAAKKATTTIPIVMTSTGDPVASGIVESLARPGGNVTGLSQIAPELAGKRLQLLKELAPKLSRVGAIWSPQDLISTQVWNEIQRPARELGVQLHSLETRSVGDFDKTFEGAIRARVDALAVLPAPVFVTNRQRIVDFAGKQRLPSIYHLREFVDSGGLVAYGPDRSDLFRRAATYVDKILKGAKPADLPVERPTKFELVINLKTAKALGLTIPQSLLGRADELIQ